VTVHVQSLSPGNRPALVRNADFRPLSDYPPSIWRWRDAIKAVVGARNTMVALAGGEA
jgi:hypothetical protein